MSTGKAIHEASTSNPPKEDLHYEMKKLEKEQLKKDVLGIFQDESSDLQIAGSEVELSNNEDIASAIMVNFVNIDKEQYTTEDLASTTVPVFSKSQVNNFVFKPKGKKSLNLSFS